MNMHYENKNKEKINMKINKINEKLNIIEDDIAIWIKGFFGFIKAC